MKRWIGLSLAFAVALVAAALVGGCGGGRGSNAALKTYVKPGEHDTHYAFLSGGHSGQVFVYGLPSCRYITTIPVFTPEPAKGYGIDEESKAMLKGFTWGDAHHPGLSETNGDYDGRWLFINDMPNARIARIDLSDFTTREIFGPIPNVSAAHACPFPTPNTEYVFAASRFSIPLPFPSVAKVEDYQTKFKGIVAGVKVSPEGHMSLGFEILTPPFDWDLSDAGKGPSEGWQFFTCYNSEEAHDSLEIKASQNEMDYFLAVNWREAQKASDAGKGHMLGGVPVLTPSENKGICYLVPVPKSPHGVDVTPSGEFICCSGKLQAEVTVYNFKKMMDAIQAGKFEKEVEGIPVIAFQDVMEARVPVGLGPLHTQFDNKGYAYTSLFLDSQIAKWKVGPPWNVVDKIDVYYSIGHLAASGGDTRHPTGEYLLALDKLSKDRYLPVGPSHPEATQLIDIRGSKMELLYDFPTYPEPHYAQIIEASKLKPLKIYSLADNKNPDAVKSADQTRVERHGRRVDAYMLTIRTHFTPDIIRVAQGDTIYFHVTNLEQDEDITHGFGITFSSKDMQVEPGETKTMRWVAERAGIQPFYCSNFCSALHQEMQGYIEVNPPGTKLAQVARPSPEEIAEVTALLRR
ncbi:MAG TPA: Sec-dependent nitrous-oxide reductase [Candidatus Eisenbacteria bacterium]